MRLGYVPRAARQRLRADRRQVELPLHLAIRGDRGRREPVRGQGRRVARGYQMARVGSVARGLRRPRSRRPRGAAERVRLGPVPVPRAGPEPGGRAQAGHRRLAHRRRALQILRRRGRRGGRGRGRGRHGARRASAAHVVDGLRRHLRPRRRRRPRSAGAGGVWHGADRRGGVVSGQLGRGGAQPQAHPRRSAAGGHLQPRRG